MPKLNGYESCLKPETPLYLAITHQIDLLRSLRPQPNVQHQDRRGPQRSQTPHYLQIEPTLYLIIRSFNYRISSKLTQTTSLLLERKWPTSLAAPAETHRRTYVRNTPRTQQNPSSLKKKWLTTYLLSIRTLLGYRMPALAIKV